MGDHHTDLKRGTSFHPSKYRLLLAWTTIALTVVTMGLAIAYLLFPLKQRAAVAAQVNQATTAIETALSTVPVFPKLEERLNILVMGVDWNGNEGERYHGNRSDTMMLVSIDPDNNRVGIISIPRDSHVTIRRGGVNKINQAHAVGGPEFAMATVRDNFSVPVDNYVVVDTVGLKDIFKLLGPVEVVVEKEMHYEDKTSGLSIDLKPGKQLLDAEQAEGYVRFRKDATADLGRMERQQWFLRQSLNKLKDPAVLVKAPQLLEAGYKCVKTDLPVDKIAATLSFVKDLPPASIVTSTLPGEGETIDGVNYFILNQKGTEAVFERFGLLQAEHRDRRHHEEEVACDQEMLRKKTRLSIKYRSEMAEQAEAMADLLRERGWRVRQIITRLDNDCLHAQLDLHNRRASQEVISLIRNDLPELSDWPVVLKYGCGSGCDLTLILPDSDRRIGMEGATTAAMPPQSDAMSVQVQ